MSGMIESIPILRQRYDTFLKYANFYAKNHFLWVISIIVAPLLLFRSKFYDKRVEVFRQKLFIVIGLFGWYKDCFKCIATVKCIF